MAKPNVDALWAAEAAKFGLSAEDAVLYRDAFEQAARLGYDKYLEYERAELLKYSAAIEAGTPLDEATYARLKAHRAVALVLVEHREWQAREILEQYKGPVH